VIFDRVISTNPSFVKTWQLQAAKPAKRVGQFLRVTNDEGGRLFLQALLPKELKITLNTREDLYTYDGENYAPKEIRGPAPECRISVSPGKPAKEDFFLNILTATNGSVDSPLTASYDESDKCFFVRIGEDLIEFQKERIGGRIELRGIERELTGQVLAEK